MKLAMNLMAAAVALLVFTSSAMADGKKKVLYIDSYHAGYAWSDGITEGIKKVLGDKYELKILRMDTKIHPGEDFKKKAGEKAKQEIEAFKPDVVIAADDNASQYVIVPYFKDKDLPFVFCGLNWDASRYGFPTKNVTGMLEVSMVTPLKDAMGKFAKGQRVGFLGADNETDHKESEMITKKFNLPLTSRFVKTFDEWKAAYKELQSQVDMLLIINNAGITGWNDAEAKKFVLENTKVPSGTVHDHVAPFVLIGYTKLATEQGEWAAQAAVKIMEGKSPKDIPVAENQKGQLFINVPLAQKMGVTFPLEMLKAAKVIKSEGKS
jgi:ABC-type uncharacterized transport system substrate-binding protein